jgi:hypothetical protein
MCRLDTRGRGSSIFRRHGVISATGRVLGHGRVRLALSRPRRISGVALFLGGHGAVGYDRHGLRREMVNLTPARPQWVSRA